MKKKSKSKPARLSADIEKVLDSKDTELLPYIQSFMEGLPEAVALEKFSLATEDEAKQALVILDNTLKKLDRQMHHLRALQRIVSEEK